MGAKSMMTAQLLLLQAGWSPGRRVEVGSMLAELCTAGHDVVAPAREFLATYSGLTIRNGNRVLRIDGHRAARNADVEWCADYTEAIGRAVTPVGEYSHLTLMIDESGEFWGGFDADYGLLGKDLVEVVHALMVDPVSGRLDRELPDL
jgi:hypothetical protein